MPDIILRWHRTQDEPWVQHSTPVRLKIKISEEVHECFPISNQLLHAGPHIEFQNLAAKRGAAQNGIFTTSTLTETT